MDNIITFTLCFFVVLLSFNSCKNKNNNSETKLSEAEIREHQKYDDLLADKLSVFAALPSDVNNPENPFSDAKVELGHFLYFDTQLSAKGNNSCNSCHNLATFGVDNLATSPGDEGKNGDRNSPTTLNAAVHTSQFWDGRAKDVEEQAGMPILNPVEMNIPNEAFLIERLSKSENYQKMFKIAFPESTNPITYENLRKAIAAFERKLITPSRFDDYLNGDKMALSVEEKKGLVSFIFIGCTTCHTGNALGGNMFQKFGVHGNYWDFTKSEKIDEGKFAVTKNEFDKYLFKVPSLRNIEKTGPYFHDGSINSLEEAVKIMAKVQLDYNLDEDESKNIIAFLKSLTADIPDAYKKDPTKLP